MTWCSSCHGHRFVDPSPHPWENNHNDSHNEMNSMSYDGIWCHMFIAGRTGWSSKLFLTYNLYKQLTIHSTWLFFPQACQNPFNEINGSPVRRRLRRPQDQEIKISSAQSGAATTGIPGGVPTRPRWVAATSLLFGTWCEDIRRFRFRHRATPSHPFRMGYQPYQRFRWV